jgi:predicted acetyltransferase
VRVGPDPAGFVFVRGLAAGAGPLVMGEFLVVRAVRRRGVGRAAARMVLARHPGAWEIPFQEANAEAARFWLG